MRDLLFLSHRIPFPPDKGDKIRSYHTFRHLTERFRVHLGCFYDDAGEVRHLDRLRAQCADIFCLPLTRTQKMLRATCGAVSGMSFSEACYRDSRMTQWVTNRLVGDAIKDIYVFCSAMAPYALAYAGAKRIVVDMVDVDSEKWGDYARSMRWPMRLVYQTEQRRLLELEKRAAAACDRSLFVSTAEADAFSALAPESAQRVSCMENGVDLDYFNPALAWPNPFPSVKPRVLFTGAMNYHPNVDAVSWFAREIFPAIRSKIPDAEFWIVGAKPASRVQRLGQEPNLRVTGAVPDIRPYLSHATCAVAPLRIARGTQNKVLEAMAMGKPVVATGRACQGLNVVAGREVLVADRADDFAGRVAEVLEGCWRDIGGAARSRVETDCRWPEKLRMLDRIFPT